MEKVLFISRTKNLKYAGQEYGRIYFGNEFCERLIPAVAEVEKVRDYCKKHKTGFSLVTPYVTDAGMAKLDKLFSFLLGNGESCEVIVNDYGVLSLINEEYPGLRPVLGRLLTKQKRDPRIAGLISGAGRPRVVLRRASSGYDIIFSRRVPAGLAAYFKETNINIAAIRAFLAGYRIRRAEVDNLLQGMNIRIPKGSFQVSLYFPFAYITTTRLCSADPFREAKKFTCAISSCSKKCLQYSVKLKNKNIPGLIYKKGNTLFFRNDILPRERDLAAQGIDRLVYQPEIPI